MQLELTRETGEPPLCFESGANEQVNWNLLGEQENHPPVSKGVAHYGSVFECVCEGCGEGEFLEGGF